VDLRPIVKLDFVGVKVRVIYLGGCYWQLYRSLREVESQSRMVKR
jgi:hypothetical protein